MHNRRLPVGHNCMGTLHVSFHGIPLPLVSRLRKLAERLYADKSVKLLVQQDVMRSVQAKQGYVPSEKVSRGGSAVPGGVARMPAGHLGDHPPFLLPGTLISEEPPPPCPAPYGIEALVT